MPRELDSEPVVRTLMLAGDKAFDHLPRAHVQPRDALQRFRIEVLLRCGHLLRFVVFDTRRCGTTVSGKALAAGCPGETRG